MSQFTSPKQIILSLSEVVLSNRQYISEVNGTLSTEGACRLLSVRIEFER